MVNPSVINLPTAGKSALPPPAYIQIALKPDEAASIGITGGNNPMKQQTVTSRAELVRRMRDMHAQDGELAIMITADTEKRTHGSMRRRRGQCVSSPMLPYQMTRYWLKVR